MSEELKPIIQTDKTFHFHEGTPGEILDQMPEEIVRTLAEHTLSTLPDMKVNSFIGNGVMLKLNKIDGTKQTYSAHYVKSIESVNNSLKSDEYKFHPERVNTMEITPKEYTDQRIDSLEKSIDHRFDSNEKLISEKIDHLHTKFEKTLDSKLGTLKESIFAEQSTQTQNNRSNMIGIIGVATAIIVGAITILLTGISIAIAIYL